MSNCQCRLHSSQMSAGKRQILKMAVHKKKSTHIIKKSYWSGGIIDLWYLEWQRQEKHIELFFLFTSKLIRFWILHSDWVRLNLFISCFIMVCLPGKVIVIASQMFLLQSQLTFITKFYLTWNSRTLFLSLQYQLLFLEHN